MLIFIRFACDFFNCFFCDFISIILSSLTVSIRSENFASIGLRFPEPSILNKCAEYFQVKISHGYMIVYDIKIMSTLRNNLISGSFPEYGNFLRLFHSVISFGNLIPSAASFIRCIIYLARS